MYTCSIPVYIYTYNLHLCATQALTLYLVWDEEAELSEEDTVLSQLLTASDEDSDDGEWPEISQERFEERFEDEESRAKK